MSFQALKRRVSQVSSNAWGEVIARVLIIGTTTIFHLIAETPFERIIQPEDAWKYRFPIATAPTVPAESLTALIFLSTLAVFLIAYGIHGRLQPALIALSVPSFAIPLTGLLTDIMKVAIGRQRPDFLSRCYGTSYKSVTDPNLKCTGDWKAISGGRRSFPSGHSSLSFCALGFLSLYLASQLKTFVVRGSGSGWRLLVTIIPLVAALLVAISRTCDYRHHWEDVTVGSLLGVGIVYITYRQYYPSLTDPNCHQHYDYDYNYGDENNNVNRFADRSTISGRV